MTHYKSEIVFLSFLGVISAIANGVVPFIAGRFFDAILDPGKMFVNTQFEIPIWVWFLSLLALTQVVANIVDWVNDVRSRKIGTSISTGYPAEAVSRLLRLPISVHKEEKAGDIWRRIHGGREAMWQIIERVIISLSPQMLSVVIGVSIAFTIQPLLAWIIVVGVLIYIGTLLKIVPPIIKLQKKGQKAWGEAFGISHDAISNVQSIKQSTAEEYESKRVEDVFVKKVRKIWFRVEGIWSGISFYQRLLITFTQISILISSTPSISYSSGEIFSNSSACSIPTSPFCIACQKNPN